MNEKVTKAMEICAKEVREISCVRCLHYEKCVRNGSPISMLGRYLAWLNLTALKPIAYELRKYCVKDLMLKAYAPDIAELEKGAYAVISAYSGPDKKHLMFRLKLQGIETEEEIKARILNLYAKRQRKIRK